MVAVDGILLANVQVPSATGSNRLATKLLNKARTILNALAHVIGDPVDFIFTLLSQVEAFKECWKVARHLRSAERDLDDERAAEIQHVAIILAAFERIFDHVLDRQHAQQYLADIIETLRLPDIELVATGSDGGDAYVRYEAKVARNLVVVRTRHLAPAIVALVFYSWQITGAMVYVVGGNPSPSGGRVAMALILSWIIYIVLFSNIVGDVASPSAYKSTINKYLNRRPLKFNRDIEPGVRQRARREIAEALEACVGTTYYTGYRYSFVSGEGPGIADEDRASQTKSRRRRSHYRHSPRLLRFMAHMPVAVGLVTAIAVTSLSPTYFSVRHFFLFGVGAVYHIISPALTSLLRDRWNLQAVRWKNALIAALMIGLFLSNSFGVFFNNGRGWKTIYPRNHGVVIFSEHDYDVNNNERFPIIASVAIAMQVFLCIITSLFCAKGLEVMRLREPS